MMRAGVSGWLLQLGQPAANGTDGNATGNVTVEGIGPVDQLSSCDQTTWVPSSVLVKRTKSPGSA